MGVDSDLMRGVAEPIVLELVSQQPMYGYEIIKVVNERTNGALEWKEGTLYPCLHRLESEGLVRSRWRTAETGRRRKYYEVTRKGAELLKKKKTEWRDFAASVNVLLFGALGG
jgi:DNA-binding PadR family transcriptional regulator